MKFRNYYVKKLEMIVEELNKNFIFMQDTTKSCDLIHGLVDTDKIPRLLCYFTKRDDTTKEYVIASCPELNGKLLEDGYVLTYLNNTWVMIRPKNIRRMERLFAFYSKEPKVWKKSEIEAVLAFIVTELNNIDGWNEALEY